jgi:molecular chaperone Hsp33
MTDKIVKGIIFDNGARVTIISTTDIVNKEIALHSLSPLSTAVLGRTLTLGAYISTNLKNPSDTFSLSINGGGIAGNVIVAGEGGNFIRGCIGNPVADLPVKEDGHLDVGGAVGKDGFITVIKDFGLKEPYIGRCQLVNGEIAEDFNQYLYRSEGIKNAVALGVRMDSTGCIGAGGVIIEALPDLTDENKIFMLEDIMSNFKNVSEILAKKTPEEIFDYYFGHLDSQLLPTEELQLRCNCNENKIKNMVLGLGKKEADSIIEDLGKIEIVCQFCGKKYIYTKEDVEKLWAI